MKDSKTIIGKAPALKSLLRNVQIISPTGVNVLITGETGTGKEFHRTGPAGSPFDLKTGSGTLGCAS
jgi:transcriptional regulator of aromatic amino acid metabolism